MLARAALAASLLLIAAPAAAQPERDALLDEAGRARAAGELEAARRAYARADPVFPEHLCRYVDVLLDLGRVAEARRVGAPLRPDPEGGCAWAALGRLEEASRAPIAAALAYRRALAELGGASDQAGRVRQRLEALPSRAQALSAALLSDVEGTPPARSPRELCAMLRADASPFFTRVSCRVARRRGSVAALAIVRERVITEEAFALAVRDEEGWRLATPEVAARTGQEARGEIRLLGLRRRGRSASLRVERWQVELSPDDCPARVPGDRLVLRCVPAAGGWACEETREGPASRPRRWASFACEEAE